MSFMFMREKTKITRNLKKSHELLTCIQLYSAPRHVHLVTNRIWTRLSGRNQCTDRSRERSCPSDLHLQNFQTVHLSLEGSISQQSKPTVGRRNPLKRTNGENLLHLFFARPLFKESKLPSIDWFAEF